MPKNLRVVIVGGVACGTKAGARLKRLMPDAEITVLDRGKIVSYGACGLPYVVSKDAPGIESLWQTPLGVERNPAFFKKVKGFNVFTETEARKINREKKCVEAVHLPSGEEKSFPFDKLVLATGSTPVLPPIKGLDLDGVGVMLHPDDATQLNARLEKGEVKKAVIVGAGLIGVEMAEALVNRGVAVTMVEMLPHPLGALVDEEIGRLAMKHLTSRGVRLCMGERAEELLGDERGRLVAVRTGSETLEADHAVIAVGVKPRGDLAQDAGLRQHRSGAIAINEFCQTSDPDIYAGGDCTANNYLPGLMENVLYTPQGSTANKHGRVIASHIAGLPKPFPGVLGTVVCKAFAITIGRAGLSEKQAKELGLPVETALWAGPDLPHFYPGGMPMIFKLISDKETRKLLGVQVVGQGDCAKRLDVAATALSFGATVDQLSHLDLGYAPPYSPPLDPLHVAANVLQNKLDGITRGISPLDVKKRMDEGDDNLVLVDVRMPQELETLPFPYREKTISIPLGALRERLGEIPRDKEILTFCKVSLRGYEAERILSGAGFPNVAFIEGGVVGWPF